MKRVISMTGLFLLLIHTSCKHSLKPADYINYVRNADKGLVKNTEIDGWKYAIQYRPSDYTIYLEQANTHDAAQIAKRKSELKGTAWFDMKISRTDGNVTPLRYNVSSLEEYNQRLNYFLNDAQKDIQLIYGDDTLRPISYVFENNYNLTANETMVVGFELPGKNSTPQTIQLSYTDRVFKNGIIKSTFHTRDIENTPNLNY